ncbi:MAG: PEP-CTERM-box response regulator transcription factor [Gammaproteobacteria bacterium]|nr:PEP-CTERM-box response regulator transcription factor [Gammaproteobacteria bacterium]
MKENKRSLLVIEDDPGLQSQMKWCFDKDIEIIIADDNKSALTALRRFEPAVVTLDLGLPPDPGGSSEGFKLLEEIIKLSPNTKVIIITGREEKENAVKAIGMGAYDFYQKPVEAETLSFVVERAFKLAALEQKTREFEKNQAHNNNYGIITSSPEMLHIIQMIEKVAPSDITTLILGKTGTGKELIAKALHSASNRSDAPFSAINCAAIPENLLESELFGHEKGAFTGAHTQKKGKIEITDSGTLFLDEIGDMPPPLQAKLLRFLQERSIERVGGTQEIPVNVRVVCATHQDLRKLISEGDFREDLFYRLSEIIIDVPSLQERQGDTVIIANALLESIANDQGTTKKRFNDDALKAIEQHPWPGNVRELVNKIKRAVIMANGQYITAEDLDLDTDNNQDSMPFNLREVRANAERLAILRALSHCHGKIAQSSRLLGVTRPTLYTLLEKYDIPTRQKESHEL